METLWISRQLTEVAICWSRIIFSNVVAATLFGSLPFIVFTVLLALIQHTKWSKITLSFAFMASSLSNCSKFSASIFLMWSFGTACQWSAVKCLAFTNNGSRRYLSAFIRIATQFSTVKFFSRNAPHLSSSVTSSILDAAARMLWTFLLSMTTRPV